MDASWGGEEKRRSMTGLVMMLADGPVVWGSKRQTCVALSTAEAEYMAASTATREAMYLRHLLEDMGYPQFQATILHEDNQPCIHVANNPGLSPKLKHIDLHYHFVRERVEDGDIQLQYIDTAEQIADIFTKFTTRDQLERQRVKIMSTYHEEPP